MTDTTAAMNAKNLGCSITCKNLEASIRFYRDAIGFSVAQTFENEGKVVAAVVVGGTAIRGGRGTFAGTLLGVILLGAIGPALTFLGVNAYWERAIQGAIILAALVPAALARRSSRSAA